MTADSPSTRFTKADDTTRIGGPDASPQNAVCRNVSALPIASDGRLRASVLDQDDSSCVHHQQRAQQITASANRFPEGHSNNHQNPTSMGPYFHASEGVNGRPKDFKRPFCDAYEIEDPTDEEHRPELPVRQGLCLVPIPRGECLSRSNRYDGVDRGIPNLLPHSDGDDVPLDPAADRVMPHRPAPIARLAKIDAFKGEGNGQLDTFFDQEEEFAAFFHWGEHEPCREARAHLRGTALAYVKRAPFLPRP